MLQSITVVCRKNQTHIGGYMFDLYDETVNTAWLDDALGRATDSPTAEA